MCPPAEMPPIEMEAGLILREAADCRTYCGLSVLSTKKGRVRFLTHCKAPQASWMHFPRVVSPRVSRLGDDEQEGRCYLDRDDSRHQRPQHLPRACLDTAHPRSSNHRGRILRLVKYRQPVLTGIATVGVGKLTMEVQMNGIGATPMRDWVRVVYSCKNANSVMRWIGQVGNPIVSGRIKGAGRSVGLRVGAHKVDGWVRDSLLLGTQTSLDTRIVFQEVGVEFGEDVVFDQPLESAPLLLEIGLILGRASSQRRVLSGDVRGWGVRNGRHYIK